MSKKTSKKVEKVAEYINDPQHYVDEFVKAATREKGAFVGGYHAFKVAMGYCK